MFLILLIPVILMEKQTCYCYSYIPPLTRQLTRSLNNKENVIHERSPLTLRQPQMLSFSTVTPLSMTTIITPAVLSNNVNTVYRLGGVVGMIGLLCQYGLTKLFQRYTLTKDNAGYTAHTVVTFVFMTYVSIVGSIGWYSNVGINGASSLFSALSPFDRLLLPYAKCQHMATIVTGMLLLWDLPTSIFLRSLRKIDVLIHHIIMAITSFFAATAIPMYYVYFYFGVSEISSIPLLLYDQLCVWTKDSATVQLDDASIDNEIEDGQSDVTLNGVKNVSSLTQWRDRIQIVTAIAFTFIRAILFTHVTVRHFIPDTISILKNANSFMVRPVQVQALRFALYASIGFTSLQLYWFSQMLQTIYKQVVMSSKS